MIDALGEDPTLHSTDVASFLRDNMATSTLVTLREGTTGVSEEILRCCDDVTYIEMSAGGAVEALQRHALVVIELRMTDDAGLRQAIVHGGVQYVERGGSMLIVHDDALPSDCGLGSSDLVGGLHAWRALGLPVHEPDHSHLDWCARGATGAGGCRCRQ